MISTTQQLPISDNLSYFFLTYFVFIAHYCRVLVGIYNPLISIVSMMVLPLSTIYSHPSDMLAVMAHTLGGSTFHTIMCVDAVVILCGGVLTAIVGECRIDGIVVNGIVPSLLVCAAQQL